MPNSISQHVRAPDPIAAISGGLLTLAGMAGFRERFGLDLTADQLAEIVGIVITIAASVRHWWERRKSRKPMTREEVLAELERLDDELDLRDKALSAAEAGLAEVRRHVETPEGPEFVSGDSDASDGGA